MLKENIPLILGDHPETLRRPQTPSRQHLALMRVSKTSSYVHSSHLVGHQGGNRAADLVILWAFSQRAEQDEEKPERHKALVNYRLTSPDLT